MYETYLSLLREFVSYKSISTDTSYREEIARTASWLESLFIAHGAQCQRIEGYGNPVIVAHVGSDKDKPTRLVYGHYDVQPAVFEDGWSSDPFVVTEKKGRLYGRGIADNKGQVLIHIVTVLDLFSRGLLSENVIFLLEGDEETGSEGITRFIKDHKKMLHADSILVSDGEIMESYPLIESSYRGMLNVTLTVDTSHTELHSGLYGGSVPNSIHELLRLIETLYTGTAYKPLSKVFGLEAQRPSSALLKAYKTIPFSLERFKKVTGTKALLTEKNMPFSTSVGEFPAVSVTGIYGGYTGAGYKNAIPPRASAKINIRLTPEQDGNNILKALKAHITRVSPSHVRATLSDVHMSGGVRIDTQTPFHDRARSVLKKVWKKDPIIKPVGGTLPIVKDFKALLNVPIVLVPFANEDCGMHAVDENFRVDHIQKFLRFSEELFSTKS